MRRVAILGTRLRPNRHPWPSTTLHGGRAARGASSFLLTDQVAKELADALASPRALLAEAPSVRERPAARPRFPVPCSSFLLPSSYAATALVCFGRRPLRGRGGHASASYPRSVQICTHRRNAKDLLCSYLSRWGLRSSANRSVGGMTTPLFCSPSIPARRDLPSTLPLSLTLCCDWLGLISTGAGCAGGGYASAAAHGLCRSAQPVEARRICVAHTSVEEDRRSSANRGAGRMRRQLSVPVYPGAPEPTVYLAARPLILSRNWLGLDSAQICPPSCRCSLSPAPTFRRPSALKSCPRLIGGRSASTNHQPLTTDR